MKKYSFYLDIDGTLTFKGDRLSDEITEALKKAREKGHIFFINTARPYSMIQDSLRDTEVFDGIICGGGTYIVYQGKKIYEKTVEKSVLFELVDILDKVPYKGTVIFEGVTDMYYKGEAKPWFKGPRFHQFSDATEFKTLCSDARIQKFATANPERLPKEIYEVYSKWFEVVEHENYTEGLFCGHNKGSGIATVERILNLEHGTTVAIGDSYNDTHMFEYAQISVAMGNAPEGIRQMCDFVTDSVENSGVAKAVKKLTGIV